MKNYMYDLLNNIEEDKGITINILIETGVLSKNNIIDKALETKNAYILYNIALYVKKLTKEDINKIADYIIKIGDLDTLYEYAANITNAPIDKIINKIIEIGEAKYIFRMALCIKEKKEYIERLANEIINLKEAEYIYLFARDLFNKLSEEAIYRLGYAIEKTNDIEYIYEFIKNVNCGSTMSLVLSWAIVNSKNEKYIEKLRKLPNAPANLNLMIERVELEEKTEYEQLTQLYALVKLRKISEIEYNACIYRKLFFEQNELIQLETEEEKTKKRVLTKEQG